MENVDDFWKDCLERQNTNKSFLNERRNENFFQNKNPSVSRRENIYKKFIEKHPEILEKEKKKKGKNLGIKKLYNEEMKKRKKREKENQERKQMIIDKELSLYTFKPKILKRKKDDNVIYRKYYEKDIKKIKNLRNGNKSEDNIKTERNKVEKKSKEKKKKKLKKSQSFFDEKENAQFILRYVKARDEKMMKEIQKLYKKDDSYSYYLNTVTSRLGNNEYKNILNVNHSIGLYGESIIKNTYLNSPIGDFKGLDYNDNSLIQQTKKSKKIIMNEIRKSLQNLETYQEEEF